MSALVGANVIAYVCGPSIRLSSRPVTVTVCTVFHVLSLNVRFDGLAAASPVSPLLTTTVTGAVGSVDRRTVNVSAVPSSLVATAVFDSTKPASSSVFVPDTATLGRLL